MNEDGNVSNQDSERRHILDIKEEKVSFTARLMAHYRAQENKTNSDKERHGNQEHF
jgi:hypothetical protein